MIATLTDVPLAVILLAALAIDGLIGDPPGLWRRVGHPVAWLGRLVGWLDRRLNDPAASRSAAIGRGAAAAAIAIAIAAAAGFALSAGFDGVPFGWIGEAAVAAILLAFRGLYDHVGAVATGLEQDLEAGRAAVGHIVGRDTAVLDDAGVARAAIESLAENFSDGTVAPAFWFLLLGLPGLAAYKAVNTLDSMIGHRSPRYEAFGKVSARLDDAVNWVPARLTGVALALAAPMVRRAGLRDAWRAMVRDAGQHRSPNAGWPASARAGALGVRLAGPRRYHGSVVDDAWMGDGRAEASAADIRAALSLYLATGILLAGGLLIGSMAVS